MAAQEKRLGDSSHLNRSLLVRCKSVEALSTTLTAELQKEKRELTSLMRYTTLSGQAKLLSVPLTHLPFV
eukprot:COSAG03_NODE_4392_length_1567_cov_1357.054496_3_plen_70_part_00